MSMKEIALRDLRRGFSMSILPIKFPTYFPIVFTKLENVLHCKDITYTVGTNAYFYYYKHTIQ
jgi:hypothetical protein